MADGHCQDCHSGRRIYIDHSQTYILFTVAVTIQIGLVSQKKEARPTSKMFFSFLQLPYITVAPILSGSSNELIRYQNG